MSFNGDYRSLAEACGETTHETAWVAGVDFDPYDADEMDVMRLVWEREAAATNERLRRENAELRRRLAELTGEDDYR